MRTETRNTNALFPAVLCLSLVPLGAEAQRWTSPAPPDDGVPPPVQLETLRDRAGRIVEMLLGTYEKTNFSPLIAYLQGTENASPNAVVPFISLGHAHLVRYERAGDPADLERALELFEVPVRDDVYRAWGRRWASTITLAHLMKGVYRLLVLTPEDAVLRARLARLADTVARLAADEADAKLDDSTPYLPLESAGTGDSKAEENAWEAAFLAWSANLLWGNPHAPLWEEKARLLASLSIVRDEDSVYYRGQKVATVSDDFSLDNHNIDGNPYYEAATVMLMRMGALAYRMTGHDVPPEFNHDVSGLYAAYRTSCATQDGRLVWTRPSDPGGDPTLWPLPGLEEESYTQALASQKLGDGYLWVPTPPLDVLVPDPERGSSPEANLWRAIQNGKVVWYWLDGAYLWLGASATGPAPAEQ